MLEGISLKNVQLTAYDENEKTVASEFGEMLFTRRGISGPVVLTISSYVNRKSKVSLSLDLKPALDKTHWIDAFCAISRNAKIKI